LERPQRADQLIDQPLIKHPAAGSLELRGAQATYAVGREKIALFASSGG
jgi:hypothetical protein